MIEPRKYCITRPWGGGPVKVVRNPDAPGPLLWPEGERLGYYPSLKAAMLAAKVIPEQTR